MNMTIQNEFASVTFKTQGAELLSWKMADGKEYLWQRDPAYWAKTSPVLFPYVGPVPDTVNIHGTEYKLPRHGFVKDAEFHMKEDGMEADSLGERTCLCAYEKEDYSGNEYRFRDDPVEENYDCMGLAVTDLISRRVSSMEEYMKTALAGSVVGALTGAAELVPVSGLARVGVDFLAGTSGTAAGQPLGHAGPLVQVQHEMEELKAAMLAGKNLREDELLEKHADWVEEFWDKYEKIDETNIDDILRHEIGHVFMEVLTDSGVYKRNEEGQRAFDRFISSVNDR